MTMSEGQLAGAGDHEWERRLEQVVGVIQEFAALRFDARADVGPTGDIVDAVAAGVNALGEELEASYDEIESKIAERTAELALVTQELSHRVLHDDLTGLVNRTTFWDRLDHRLAAAKRRTNGFAVLFLDLDGFKVVNDTLGHIAGDQLLVDVAHRISSELRAGDTAARVGGDEFLVLLDEVDCERGALAVAERVNAALQLPYTVGASTFTTPASVGVACGPGCFESADEVVAAADAAMYDAKRSGRGICVVYDAGRGHLAPDGGTMQRRPAR